MTDRIYSISEIKSIVAPIAEKYGAGNVYLFGSYCRGEQTEKSDLDFRVDKGRIRGLFALSGFRLDLADAFDKEVDLLTTGGLDEDFLGEIKKEEILVYGQG